MTTDPLLSPFLSALLDYREVIRQRVEMLTDEELDQVYLLFGRENLKNVPAEFWAASFSVRARIKVEQRRRVRLAALISSGANAE